MSAAAVVTRIDVALRGSLASSCKRRYSSLAQLRAYDVDCGSAANDDRTHRVTFAVHASDIAAPDSSLVPEGARP